MIVVEDMGYNFIKSRLHVLLESCFDRHSVRTVLLDGIFADAHFEPGKSSLFSMTDALVEHCELPLASKNSSTSASNSVCSIPGHKVDHLIVELNDQDLVIVSVFDFVLKARVKDVVTFCYFKTEELPQREKVASRCLEDVADRLF